MEPARLHSLLRSHLPSPKPSDDKYSRGVVGAVVGSETYPGAALLVVSAIQACSVGMVRYFGPQRVADLVLQAHPEVVAAESVSESTRVDSWVLGSGVAATADPQLQNLALAVSLGQPCVIDAGALDHLDFLALRHVPLILTPHAAELTRLVMRWLPDRPDLLATSNDLIRAEAARELATVLGQTILAKGNVTFVADSDGRFDAVGPNDPNLATAGTGDVLAGLLAGLAVHSFTGWFGIGMLGVNLHSQLAREASAQGPVVASALPAHLPAAVLALGNG